MCYNETYVKILTSVLESEYERRNIRKINKAEVYTLFFKITPREFKIKHVPFRQDKIINYKLVNIKGSPNVDTDSIVNNVTPPIHIDFLSITCAVYGQDTSTP